MKRILCLMAVATLFFTEAVAGEIYQYKDAQGTLHFTDSFNEVPKDQRKKVNAYKAIPPSNQNDSVSIEEKPPQALSLDGMTRKNQLKALQEEKAALESIYSNLLSRMQALDKERKKVKTAETSSAFKTQVDALNEEIQSYEKRRAAFDAELNAYKQKHKNGEQN
ncbi:MAG TPA: hypothetical protein DHV36_25815 [Desulfobacteraceae bacterium]|nr:hypothetical protein [Desulfobacteraceae bacterium]